MSRLSVVTDRSARIALVGVAAAALAAVALGFFITNQTREDLLLAEQRGLETAVAAISERLPPVGGPLDAHELAAVDRLVEEAILGAGHVRVKLWSLDGTVRYSDEADLIGQQFAEEASTLAAARGGVPWSGVSVLSEVENVYERGHDRLIEHYIPLADRSGTIVGVFEIYSDPSELEAALDRIGGATWLAIAAGLGALMLFLFALTGSAVRRLERERLMAQEAADASAVLASATDALATALDPPQMLDRLSGQLTSTLDLDGLFISDEPRSGAHASSHRLAHGSWLTATRADQPFSDADSRLLRAVAASFDAALARASLFDDVQQAASERRHLLRRLDVAHEEERRSLVGELHDMLAGDLIRALYGVRGILGRRSRSDAEIDAELRTLEGRIAGTERQLRGFMARLRPVGADDEGLLLAMEQAAGSAREDAGFQVRLRISGPVEDVPPDVQRVLLRSVQEALLNAQKHASAKHVLVRLRVRGDVRLTVEDDGRGFDRSERAGTGRGLGLAYARERIEALGGSLILGRSRLGGALFDARLPLVERA